MPLLTYLRRLNGLNQLFADNMTEYMYKIQVRTIVTFGALTTREKSSSPAIGTTIVVRLCCDRSYVSYRSTFQSHRPH